MKGRFSNRTWKVNPAMTGCQDMDRPGGWEFVAWQFGANDPAMLNDLAFCLPANKPCWHVFPSLADADSVPLRVAFPGGEHGRHQWISNLLENQCLTGQKGANHSRGP